MVDVPVAICVVPVQNFITATTSQFSRWIAPHFTDAIW
jgi:hypothetical protein